jgi:hypothetical protein
MCVQFTAPLAALIALAIISGCVPHGAPVTAPAEKTAEPFVAALTVEARDVPVHSEPSRSAPVVESLRSGDRLRLIERGPEWALQSSLNALDRSGVLSDLAVGGHQSDALGQRLRDQDPVERISVKWGK